MANDIKRTYEFTVFEQEFDENGRVTALTLSEDLTLLVNATSEDDARFAFRLRLANINNIDTANPNCDQLTADIAAVSAGLVVKCRALSPSL